jgi:hypothetical protein
MNEEISVDGQRFRGDDRKMAGNQDALSSTVCVKIRARQKNWPMRIFLKWVLTGMVNYTISHHANDETPGREFQSMFS